MSRLVVTLNSDGPQTREELEDALKAFHLLTGYEATSLYVPLATYKAWTTWATEVNGQRYAPFTEEDLPEKVGNCFLHIACKFRMT